MENKKKVQSLSSVEDPTKVRVLILADQKSQLQDFYFMKAFENLIKIDLSYNRLTSFPANFSFKNFASLRILFLHYNRFSNHKNLKPVCESSSLEYLTLFGNPLEQTKTRHYFVNLIPSLKLMDDKIVRIDERCPEIMLQNNSISPKLSFPLVTNLQSHESSDYLATVAEELSILRKKYLEINPLVKIQRWFSKIKQKNEQSRREEKQKEQNQVKQSKIKQIEPDKTVKHEKKQVLKTEKLSIFKSNQQKVLSILKMNSEFWNLLRKQTQNRLFALKKFCDQKELKYTPIQDFFVLRIPENPKQTAGKKYYQFILKSSQGYLIRAKGSQISSGYEKQFKKVYKKMKLRNIIGKIHYEESQKVKQKIFRLQSIYEERMVEIIDEDSQKKFNLVKEQYFNCTNKEVTFPFLFEDNLKRISAAISIQKVWRGYRIRKNVNSYQETLKKLCSIKIQRWIRGQPFKHRSFFNILSRSYIKSQNTNHLILKMDDLLFFQKVSLKIRNGNNFIFPQQRIKFFFRGDGKKVLINNKSPPYPSYFNDCLSLQCHQIKLKKDQDYLSLIFKGALSISYFDKGRYAKIVFDSINEARNRKYLLALSSYQFLRKDFIRSTFLETQQTMKQTAKNIHQNIEKIPFIGFQLPKSLSLRSHIQHKIKFFHNQMDFTKIVVIALGMMTLRKYNDLSLTGILKNDEQITMTKKFILFRQKNKQTEEIYRKDKSIKKRKPKKHNQEQSFVTKIPMSLRYQEKNIVEQKGFFSEHNTYNIKKKHQASLAIEENKQKVHEIRSSHQQKIQSNLLSKENQLKRIRKKLESEEQEQQRVIEQNKLDVLMNNMKKHEKITKKKNPNKFEDFEKKFLTRGNSSIRKQMSRYEKTKKSEERSLYNSIQSSRKQLFTKPSKQMLNFKTEIKEFSLNVSQNDLNIDSLDDEEQKEKKIEDALILDSLQEDKKRVHQSHDKRKKKKKKKMVHSVFPEEFYPLKQSKKLGFELPPIK